jgi:hypothetical protein
MCYVLLFVDMHQKLLYAAAASVHFGFMSVDAAFVALAGHGGKQLPVPASLFVAQISPAASYIH